MAVLRDNSRKAFTLVEVLVAALAALILIVGISAMLFYGHRGYNTLYRRLIGYWDQGTSHYNISVVRNAYEARKVFDAVVRKSTVERFDPLPDNPEGDPYIGNQLCVYYYADASDPAVTNNFPDRYAYFHLQGTDLILEQGGNNTFFAALPPRDSDIPALPAPDKSMVLARKVGNFVAGRNIPIFSKQGAALRMVLVLDDESEPASDVYSGTQTLKMIVTTTAVRHNKIRQ
jgi:hypothetical protein